MEDMMKDLFWNVWRGGRERRKKIVFLFLLKDDWQINNDLIYLLINPTLYIGEVRQRYSIERLR